jgi:hypothetical protein
MEKSRCGSYSQGGDGSLVTNYRPVCLNSVVCKEMEHVIASFWGTFVLRMIGYTRVKMDQLGIFVLNSSDRGLQGQRALYG